jgi:antitoxin PrlF
VVLDKDGVTLFRSWANGKSPSDRLFTAPEGKPWRRDVWAEEVRSAIAAHNKRAVVEARIPAGAFACSFRHARISELLQVCGIEIESTLTDRYQTTVPDAVRRTLKLRKRDKIRYVVTADGAVLLTRAEAGEQSDPVVGKFLAFLARDMEARPSQIRGVNLALVRRAGTATFIFFP